MLSITLLYMKQIDLICSYGFNFPCYAGYSQSCVYISALFSEFQARISGYTLRMFISQTVTCLLRTSCYDRCSGTTSALKKESSI